jgi:flagellar hook assembly protein FlgD
VIQSDNPEEFSLLSIYPNPFNNRLKILLELTKPELCNISVYNIKGQLIKTIHDGLLQQGKNHLFWDSKNTSSGLYIIQSKINNKIKNEKTILLK